MCVICKNGTALRPSSVVSGAQAAWTGTKDCQFQADCRSYRMDAGM